MRIKGWPLVGAGLCAVSGWFVWSLARSVVSGLWAAFEGATLETQVGIVALGWVASIAAAGVAVVLTWGER